LHVYPSLNPTEKTPKFAPESGWLLGIRSTPFGAKGLFLDAFAVNFRECNMLTTEE